MARLHSSLYRELARELKTPPAKPPVAIFDHHMHLGDVAGTRDYVAAAGAYGITGALGIASIEQARSIRAAFGNYFEFCGWPPLRDVVLSAAYVDACIREIEEMRGEGFRALKFKIVPDRAGRKPLVWLDDPLLKPLFTRAEELGFVVQAHIAQPDVWFDKYYSNGEAGLKEHYFHQVEYLLDEHPGLTYVGVHMGGHPENLDYLDELMECYPHFHIDTSATKWTVRELSRQREKAREFFIRRADRILFGSDLVVHAGAEPSYYTSRFHVQRRMWESDYRGRSMIRDDDSDGVAMMHALDLPSDALEQIYRKNAARILSLEEDP